MSQTHPHGGWTTKGPSPMLLLLLEKFYELKVFSHDPFGQIRTMTDEKGESWYVGKEVATILGYASPENA